MAKRQLRHCCDDPDCVLCQADDADAAFWDEFFARLDSLDTAESDDEEVITGLLPALEPEQDEDEDLVLEYSPEIVICD